MEEIKNYFKNITGVSHITFDPDGPGAIRIHLIPPTKLKMGNPWVVIINGTHILPINTSWAILLNEFIKNFQVLDGKAFSDEEIDELIEKTITSVSKIFPKTDKKIIKDDLKDIIDTFTSIAKGEKPPVEIGYVSFKKYYKKMMAPQRMDLMLSSMEKNSFYNCNQKCLYCYAYDTLKAKAEELTSQEWMKIIDECKLGGVSQLTFTGGEPTLRDDLCELISYAKWFVTRLNTNGVLLTKSLCDNLKEASLDSVQITLYSFSKEIHEILTGSKHFDETINGIKNAIQANLNVSINTPLCALNKDYLNTIKECSKLGVRYFTCSGIIPSGNANSKEAKSAFLSKDEMLVLLKEVVSFCQANNLEISFTSPGWISKKDLEDLNLTIPSCGASLSNMAVSPNGEVLSCQSDLDSEGLGNLLKTPLSTIYQSKKCKKIRKLAANSNNICLLSLKEVKHENN